MTPRERLQKAFEAAPPLAGSGAMGELTEEGAYKLLRGGSASELAGALLDLFIDVEHRDDVQPRLLACGLMRALELWDTLTVDGRMEIDGAYTLGQMFESLAHRPEILEVSQRDTFVEALLERIEALATASAPLSAKALGWVEPACSVVALAPASVHRALSPLFTLDAQRWRAALRYYAALGYPAADHPWRSESEVLWDRFGGAWTAKAIDSLGEQLADDIVRERLEAMVALASDTERNEVARIVEELAELQIPTVWGARRACLLSRLGDPDPLPYWNDELGIE